MIIKITLTLLMFWVLATELILKFFGLSPEGLPLHFFILLWLAIFLGGYLVFLMIFRICKKLFKEKIY